MSELAGHNSPIRKAQDAVCERVGANIYGRVSEFLRLAECGEDSKARQELLELLKYFPKSP